MLSIWTLKLASDSQNRFIYCTFGCTIPWILVKFGIRKTILDCFTSLKAELTSHLGQRSISNHFINFINNEKFIGNI